MSQPKKKMNLVQLTFIVAVNMMGSGIIMLPTNMAKVGAISLLSWIVTALGSMALAYGFAQAGIFNQRSGGLASYAEDAYGKDGYFQAFFLYFLSLAIGNVAIAISAVGYMATFFPGMSATPIATCMSVIALLWLTTVANFGGPGVTGKIGSITVWGVIIPVGALSFIGWFWFSSDTFAAAWNPQGMSLGEGMGSSIALTLWAFLGMESAAQNSDAVENPKRDVPLACLFGTLGAAVIYVLSTTVIQGIVPNAELAESTGPFGLAFAKMFNPTVGSIIMVLAILACLGLAAGLAVHVVLDREVRRRRQHVPQGVLEGEQPGSAHHRHDHPRCRADRAGAVDHLADAVRAIRRAGESRRGHQRHPVHPGAVRTAGDDEGQQRREWRVHPQHGHRRRSPCSTACTPCMPRAATR